MYRVLIVDDEPWVAYGLYRLIEWEKLGFEVVQQIHDGKTALHFLQEQKIDVVISDIRMPGLNGIELLTELHHQGIQTEVILISGYAEFEYAQAALRLGAFDYLVKQVDKSKLTETMIRCAEKLDQRIKKDLQTDHQLADFFELFEPRTEVTIGDFLIAKGYSCEFNAFRFVTVLHDETDDLNPHLLSSLSQENLKAISFRTGMDKWSFLMNFNVREGELHNPALAAALDGLRSYEDIGVSTLGNRNTPISPLYLESDKALFSKLTLQRSGVIEYTTAILSESYAKSLRQLEMSVKEGKTEAIHDALDKLLQDCLTNPVYIDSFAKLFNRIVTMVHKYQDHRDMAEAFEYMNYSQIARNYHSLPELFDALKLLFEHASSVTEEFSNEQIQNMISQIDVVYTQDISLRQWAKAFNISLGHVSYLFKKETGQTFSEYVTDKRLQLAKELLSDQGLTIQEIVERVGYKDYFHFNKLFKKHFGITPSKYRKF